MDGKLGEVVIAVDIGGGSVKLALTDAMGGDLGTETVQGVPGNSRDALLAAIGQRADALLVRETAHTSHLAGIAIGVPGFLSADRRASMNSNVPVLDGFDLVQHFGQKFGCDVRLENDANLAALGEWSFGPRGDAARFMMVTLGTGIGVALLDQGMPVGVMGGTLGDAGHIIVDPTGSRSCRLGCRGCLESVASGVALAEVADELATRHPNSALAAARRDGGISGVDLSRLAVAGDELTLSLLGEVARWLGLGLASYINAFAPDVIAIGGGMSRFRPFIEAALVDSVARIRIKNRAGSETVYFSSDFERAAARGAATMFFRAGGRPDG